MRGRTLLTYKTKEKHHGKRQSKTKKREKKAEKRKEEKGQVVKKKKVSREELERILTEALAQGKIVGSIKKWSMQNLPPVTGFDDFSLWDDMFLDGEDEEPLPPLY